MSILSGVPTSIPVYSGSGKLVPLPIVLGGSTGVGSQNGASAVTVSQSAGLGISAFAGIFLDILAVMIVFSLIGVFVIVVVANRADPDPRGRRPQSVYYFVVSFVTLAIAVIGSAVVVTGVDVLVGNHSNAVSNARAADPRGWVGHRRQPGPPDHTFASRPRPGSYRCITGPLQACRPELRGLSGLRVRLVLSRSVRILGVLGLRPSCARAIRVPWRPVRQRLVFLVVAAYLLLAAVVIWGTHRKLVTPGLGAIEKARPSPSNLRSEGGESPRIAAVKGTLDASTGVVRCKRERFTGRIPRRQRGIGCLVVLKRAHARKVQ